MNFSIFVPGPTSKRKTEHNQNFAKKFISYKYFLQFYLKTRIFNFRKSDLLVSNVENIAVRAHKRLSQHPGRAKSIIVVINSQETQTAIFE